MNTAIRFCLVVFALTVLAAHADQAPAADGCWGSGCGDGYYYGFYRRNLQSDQIPPYFSQFPPVYYSGVIPRPYGWSPFALRPHEFHTMPVLAPEPVMIRNPYVTEEGDNNTTDANEKTAASPRVFINPFVEAESTVRVAKHSQHR